MSERKRIYYTYKTIEAYEKYDDQVRKIITEDTKREVWICNRALPPTCYPPEVSPDTIKKLKDLSDDIVVKELEE
ncbi:hypothetical protein BO94DRAFT_586887 [Aspergillus sclerotioniger CBS 115572]|uniref:Uncharacterized protein n=1 Tax=Aspergillus sclerotioniger CBS 115572 TaxID=1450535 RepID=A0A317WFP7_9EURO|nr:hypothetical protein BO94DRAFT_586887 [Aspergillus sclerotioniger CBS 115572]PWY83838.1 hypothetical protein BO94DRAFT_586887 [Aspergillus sclerotioniger CBS 115572]